jgi:uncharacterized membrane protein YfcA
MPTDFDILALLALAAMAAGACNSVAGGGTLLTFPALTAVVTGDVANATSTVALLPGSMAGAWGYRREVSHNKRLVLSLLAPSLAGGLLGALLVVWFPKQFESLIPWLILTAAVLFLVQPVVSRLLRKRASHSPVKAGFGTTAGVIVFQFFIALYGGYFGAGIGILMLASLGLMSVGDIHKMNGVKTVLASTINAASVVVFLATPDIIRWRYAAVMAIGAILGGYLGARTARKFPPAYVRYAVIVIAFGLSAFYFWKQLKG